MTGASRGIGARLVEGFAAAGAQVVGLARTETALRDVAGRSGGHAFVVDLADGDAVRGLIGRVEDAFGPVDVLVNNAATDLAGCFLDESPADLERLFRLNIVAPVLLCREAIPRMLERGGGHVVNVASLAGIAAIPGLAAYGASKAALMQFTAGLRADLRGLPIATTVVELGCVPTDMLEHVERYAPAHQSIERLRRTQFLPDVGVDRVAAAIVDAVRHNRRHVRLPSRASPFAMLTEAPRRITEALLTGVRPRPPERN